MNDAIGLFGREQGGHRITVADVDLMKIELYVGFQLCKARLFQGHIIIIIKIIDADDLVTAVKQTQCAMHTNKASSAGDKDFQLKLQSILTTQLNSLKTLFRK